MSFAPPPRPRRRLGSLFLTLAWLIVLGVVGAAVGYVYVTSEQMQTAEPGKAPAVAAKLPEEGKAPPPAAPEEQPPAEPAETQVVQAPEGEIPEAAAVTETPAEQPATPEPPAPQTAEIAPAPEAAPQPTPEPTPEPVAKPETEAPPATEAEVADTPPPPPPPESMPPATSKTADSSAPDTTQTAALPPPPEALPLWRRNSQPFDEKDTRPRIAVVLTGLGLSSAGTEAAIKQLPAAVTLSFTPYSRKLNQWIALARVNGHEVMLDLPMEPTSYPQDDPGPRGLLTALSSRQNLERLRWTLDRATGYVGVATVMGSRFTASEQHLTPVLKALKNRGLLFLDNRASDESIAGALASEIGLPRAVNDRALDRAQASRVAIDARLVQIETIARANGTAVAMGRPYPVTIERLRVWTKELRARGFVLAPISAVADRQRLPRTAQRTTQTE